MSASRKKVALWSLLCLGVPMATVSAQQAAAQAVASDHMCAPDQLAGQYECVTSLPLSEEEVRVSLAYLAAFRSLAVHRAWDEERPVTSVVWNEDQPAPSERPGTSVVATGEDAIHE